MEMTQELFEKIEGYLNSNLEADELAMFEKELTSNEKLRDEVAMYKRVHKGLSNEDTINFRKNLLQIDKELEDAKNPVTPISSIKTTRKYWKIAAIFIFLIGLSSLLWLTNTFSSSQDQLFAEYYAPYPMSLMRGEEISNDAALQELTSNYRAKEYQKVISLLEDKITTTSDDRIKLYLGNGYLNVDKLDEAIITFQSVGKNSEFYKDAKWFLALTFIKTNAIDKATGILQDLSSHTNLYTRQASQLLDALQ